jgi:YVTN family beta-propeller protein
MFALVLLPLCGVVSAQNWTAPQPGWLYVLDSGPGRHGSILLVDPSDGSIKGTLLTDYRPNIGFCPDGSRLYLTDGLQSSAFLSIFDTQTAKLLAKVPLADRAVYTLGPATMGVGCSSDHEWVFVQIMKMLAPRMDEHSVAIFNSRTGVQSTQNLPLPTACGMAQFPAWASGSWSGAVECGRDYGIRVFRIGGTGTVERFEDIPLPIGWGQKPPVTSNVLADTTHHALTVVRVKGGLDRIDSDSLGGQNMVPDGPGNSTRPGASVISPEASLIYIGRTSDWTMPGGFSDRISVYRAGDLSALSTTEVPPFNTLSVSRDGAKLYLVNMSARSISVIDTNTMQVTKTLTGIGLRPALVWVQP